MGFFLVIMLLYMLLFGGCAFGYALFFGVTYICPQKAIMLLHMLLFDAYAIHCALILVSNMLSRGDCATTAVQLYGRFQQTHAFIHRKIFRDYQVSHKNWTLFWMIGSKINIM